MNSYNGQLAKYSLLKVGPTTNAIVRKIACLIRLLEGIESQQVQVPLVRVLLKLADLEPQWDGSWDGQSHFVEIGRCNHHQPEPEKVWGRQ
jgi:hypothetical protein